MRESLPYNAESFDVVVRQFGLMFVQQRATALREMMRVLNAPVSNFLYLSWRANEKKVHATGRFVEPLRLRMNVQGHDRYRPMRRVRYFNQPFPNEGNTAQNLAKYGKQ